MLWQELDNQSQVYLYWEYCAANPNEEITFTEFDEIMQDTIVKVA